MQIAISSTGSLRCVYDELLDLSALGQVHIQRGSYVEPDVDGRWCVNLRPVSGPRLGPFKRRSEAIDAEIDWLHRYWL